MTQREKLVELLDMNCGYVEEMPAERLADMLLSKGVFVAPCVFGTHLWRVTHPYRMEPKVTEYVVKNIKTDGKKHHILLEVQALNVPGTNYMAYEKFFTSKEEAEAVLNEMKGRKAK